MLQTLALKVRISLKEVFDVLLMARDRVQSLDRDHHQLVRVQEALINKEKDKQVLQIETEALQNLMEKISILKNTKMMKTDQGKKRRRSDSEDL